MKDKNKDAVKDENLNTENTKEDAIESEQNNSENESSDAEENNSNSNSEDEIQKLKSELEKADNLSKDYLNRLQRTMAEFDNFRKRTITEKASMYDNGVKDIVEKLLPIVDNFERAVETESEKDNAFFKGVEMILKQFKEIMTSIGVEEIEAVGEKFNPNIHNAVMHIDDENYGENEVVEQLQKGYKYKEKVIRASMVKVAN